MKRPLRIRPSVVTTCSLLLCLLASAAPSLTGQDDLAKDLKSKDASVRLRAARAVAEAGGEDAPKMLTKLLKDDDWEVVIVALDALGDCGSEKVLGDLTKLAYGGPIRHVRASASAALAKIDPEAAAKALCKKLKKDTTIPACEALVLIAPALEEFKPPKGLKKLLKDKQLRVRAAAAGAMVALTREGRGQLIEDLLDSEFLSVRAAALEVATAQPHPEQVQPIREYLTEIDLKDVLLRRALPALVAGIDLIEKGPGQELEQTIEALCASEEPRVARRGALLAAITPDYEWGARLDLVDLTKSARAHKDPGVRAGAARFLRIAKGEQALAAAHTIFDSDTSVRARLAAFDSILAMQPVTTEKTRTWIIERLATEGSRDLREAMVVALGNKELIEQGDAVQALIDTLGDSDWSVAACAAVSLGLTRSEHGAEPLTALARDASDWRLRGAGVVGLSKSLQKAGIDGVIAALDDPEPLVVRTAHSYLISIARGEVFPPEITPWATWWSDMKDKVRLYDPQERRERNKKYGYSAPPDVIYHGLDVLVLESRGDNIQAILKQLGIEHRMTMSNRLKADGLDPAGVFVSNCTGEMEPDDLDRVQWFVKVGGYLCGSCWAVTETIAKITPGIVEKIVTRDQVLDNVLASPCDPDSQFTQGVFGEHVVPIYRLEGAHIIRVLQPERVEMLVDSVECAEKWGGGNLACWFSSGHGTILDSANHFHSQGFEYAQGLKKPEQRMAYAVDHMGTTLERIRETTGEKFWTSNHRAAEKVLDYSVFRLVTNFVRLRRIEGR